MSQIISSFIIQTVEINCILNLEAIQSFYSQKQSAWACDSNSVTAGISMFNRCDEIQNNNSSFKKNLLLHYDVEYESVFLIWFQVHCDVGWY